MDDFLHNLRSGNLKQPDRNRRQYGDSQYKGPQRRTGAERRKRDEENGLQSEALVAIKELLKSILENQKRMSDVLEERNKAEERKALALEHIAARLNFMPASTVMAETAGEELQEDESEEEEPERLQPKKSNPISIPIAIQTKNPLRIDDAGIEICRLRNEGFSYAKIADTLEAKGIPTVSGKGRWRGQSVQRLFLKVQPQ
jgi:seryl-tRNA synthetase